VAPGSTQPLTEMSTKNLPRGKGGPARKGDNRTTVYEPTVLQMWEPRHLTQRLVTGIALPFLRFGKGQDVEVH
jgi:hypothetical protein